MASDAQIDALRLLVDEPEDSAPWTDTRLGEYIDEAGDLNAAANRVWTAKAAAAAGLVNVSEGGSSRSLGDLHENALTMASFYGAKAAEVSSVRATRQHRLTR